MRIIRSRLIVGAPGSGKSMGILGDLLEILKQEPMFVLLCDPHGELGRLLMLHLEALGKLKRVLYDKLGEFERVLGVAKLAKSEHPNPWIRKKENNSIIMGYVRVIWSSAQRESDGALLSHPMTFRYLKYALQLLLYQPGPTSLSWLPFCFIPRSEQFRKLFADCTDRKTKMVWAQIVELDRKQSFNLLEQQLGGAQRLIETVLDMPEFAARLDGNFDISKAMLNRQIVVLDGAGAEPEARTAIYRAMNLMVFRFLTQHFAETGKPLPTLCIWDEAPASNVIGPMEINALREYRKMGFAGWIAGQDLSFIDPILKKAIKSTTPEHCWYNPSDDELALEAAKDIGYAVLNPYLVHHSNARQRHAKPNEQKRISRTTGQFGESERVSVTESTSLVPQYEDYEEHVYTALNDQILLLAQKAMTQGPGWRLIKSPEFVTPNPVYSPLLPDPYPSNLYPGLKEKKIAKAIQASQARSEFSVPVELEEPCFGPTTPSAGNATKRPSKNLPKPRGRRGNS